LIDPPLSKIDYYNWIRDDKREDQNILDHLEQENKYSQAFMEDTTELQHSLFNEIKGRVKEDDTSYPYPFGNGGLKSKYQ